MMKAHITSRSWLIALTATVAMTGCDLDYSPDVGPLHAGSIPVDAAEQTVDATGDAMTTTASPGPCEDSNREAIVSFAASIRPLLNRSPGACTGCHGTAATSGFSVGSYEAIRRGGTVSGTNIIIPGKPCQSILYQKLGPAPPFGSRMPNSGPPYWSTADLTLMRDWIAEGALNN